MNLIRLCRKTVRNVLLLGAISLVAVMESAAQDGGVEFHSIEVTIGDTLFYNFHSDPPFLPSLQNSNNYPQHGTADLPGPNDQGVTGANTLTYIPTATSPVRDTVYFYYYQFDQTYNTIYVTLELLVVPSVVHAEDDYATTTEDQPVTIDVLANDWADVGILQIADVPLVNSGTFSLNADSTEVTFTPSPGFYGLAHFNYSICDNFGVCDVAKVSIVVDPASMPVTSELNIITPQERPVEILAELDGYTLVTPPAHGVVDMASADYHIYIPDEGVVDEFDTFVYEKDDNGTLYQHTVEVHIIDIDVPNTFVRDDIAEGIEDEVITINAIANDLGGDNLNSIAKITNPEHGTAVHLGNGIFEYTPDPDYSGQDVFIYRAMSPDYSITEYGRIVLNVSDRVPAQETFTISTASETPIVIEYMVPIDEYSFSVVVDPDFGTVDYYPGFQEVTLLGQTFSGYNMIIYTPSANASGLMDEFQVEYCVTGDNCPTTVVKFDVNVLNVVPSPEQECVGHHCVWAGDTNADGVVNMFDLLPLGMCMGEVGESRSTPDLNNWFGQYGDDWNDIMSDLSFDLKHIDADGNGIVGASDTAAISQFYLEHHSLVPAAVTPGIDVPLYFYETASTPVPGGTHIEMDIWLGDPNDQLAEDIYGLAFTLEYESDLVVPGSVNLDFQNESWLSYNSPILHMVEHPADGRVDAGITRTSGKAANGYGVVATLDFVVIEDINGGRLLDNFIDLRITAGAYMNSAGHMVGIPDDVAQIPLALEADDEYFVSSLDVYPNPSSARDGLNVHVNGVDTALDAFSVFTMTGQQVRQVGNIGARTAQLDLYGLPSGMYMVRAVTTDGSVLTQKFEIID